MGIVMRVLLMFHVCFTGALHTYFLMKYIIHLLVRYCAQLPCLYIYVCVYEPLVKMRSGHPSQSLPVYSSRVWISSAYA